MMLGIICFSALHCTCMRVQRERLMESQSFEKQAVALGNLSFDQRACAIIDFDQDIANFIANVPIRPAEGADQLARYGLQTFRIADPPGHPAGGDQDLRGRFVGTSGLSWAPLLPSLSRCRQHPGGTASAEQA